MMCKVRRTSNGINIPTEDWSMGINVYHRKLAVQLPDGAGTGAEKQLDGALAAEDGRYVKHRV